MIQEWARQYEEKPARKGKVSDFMAMFGGQPGVRGKTVTGEEKVRQSAKVGGKESG